MTQSVSPPTKTPVEEVPTLMTAEELLVLPHENQRYELIEGELIVMSPAGTKHGRVANTASFLLTEYVRKNNLGVVYAAETGFKLRENPDTVRAADVSFVAQSRIPEEGEPEGFWAIAPDLVVEVVSPYDSARGIQNKIKDWLTAGCRLVWIVYPDSETVTAYRALNDVQGYTNEQTIDGGEVLSGFSCQVSEFFA